MNQLENSPRNLSGKMIIFSKRARVLFHERVCCKSGFVSEVFTAAGSRLGFHLVSERRLILRLRKAELLSFGESVQSR